MYCKYCGEQINDNEKYCRYCGRAVLRVPPIFTMNRLRTDIATDVIRSYSEWGFYNNPDADLDPETGKAPQIEFNTLQTMPDENPLKWAKDFMEADEQEAKAAEEAPKEDAAEEAGAGENEKNKKRKKVPVALIVILVILLAAAVAGAAYMLFINDKSYEIDLQTIMEEPKVIGYDGYGEMALMPQVDDAKEDAWLAEVRLDNDKEDFRAVIDTVTYTPDKTKDLSNGDKVTITIDYDKKLAKEKNLKVIAQPLEYEVAGLEIGKDLAYDPDAYHAYYDDFILPESDRTYVTREDIAYSTNGSQQDTQRAINEIYARHGWIFGSEYYDKLFRGFDWYIPMYKPDEFDNSWLNKYEKENLNLLTEYRDELKKAEEEAAKKEAEQKAREEAAQSENGDSGKTESSKDKSKNGN